MTKEQFRYAQRLKDFIDERSKEIDSLREQLKLCKKNFNSTLTFTNDGFMGFVRISDKKILIPVYEMILAILEQQLDVSQKKFDEI